MDTDETLALEFSSIDDLIKHGFKNLVQGIKHSNQLPIGSNYDFCNTNASFNKLFMEDGGRILRIMNHIMNSQDVPTTMFNRTNDEREELLVDANDEILEGVANMIDEYSGVKKKHEIAVEIETVSARLPTVNGSWNRIGKIAVSSAAGMPHQKDANPNRINLISAKNIIRPQKFFKDKIDNSNLYPWQPRIADKPNSIKQLSLYVEDSEFGSIYSHPYEIELERFKPLPDALTRRSAPAQYQDVFITPLIDVSTEEELSKMLGELRKVTEIAVDLEHHNYRSFMGITCLMQISIPGKDFLVDTLALRDKLSVLNEVFTKESIVKIFHGADSDILWLQRDLSLYIVNLFDTHQAAILLNYPRRSLACLLTKFCKFAPNKHFQLADWRIRPLPDELKKYAREDTHYLIYIYHMMRNELLDEGKRDNHLLTVVFERSKEICLKRYIKPICAEDSHLKFYRNCKRFFDNRQLFALRQIYNWRDNIAREEDESTGYVLPNHMMLQICESLPREMQGIFACCNPVPPLLRANALIMHNFILKAREQPLEKAILKEDNRAKGSTLQFSRLNMDGPLYCPHDIIKSAEICSDLPTLLNNSNNVLMDAKLINLDIQKHNSSYSVFDLNENNYEPRDCAITRNLTFLGPYERYKLVKPFVQAELEKEQEKDRKLQENQDIVVDKTADPSVEDRIAILKRDCSIVSTAHSKNKEKSLPKKVDEKKHRSIRQQYPNTKRKRRSSIEFDDVTQNNAQKLLSSTIPNVSVENPRKRLQNLREVKVSVPQNSKNPQIDQQIANNDSQNKKRNERNRNRNRREKRKQLKYDLPSISRDALVDNSGASEPFQPFDYGTVDFMRFGGVPSQSNPKQQNLKTQFKGRGQSKTNFRGKNTNKSSLFFKNERRK